MKDDDLVRRSIREKIAQEPERDHRDGRRIATSVAGLLLLLLMLLSGAPVPPEVILAGIVLCLFLAERFGLDDWIKWRFSNTEAEAQHGTAAGSNGMRLSMPNLGLIGIWVALLIYAFFRVEGTWSYVMAGFVATWVVVRVFFMSSLAGSARRSKQRQFDRVFALRRVKDPATIDYLAAVGTAQLAIGEQAVQLASHHGVVKAAAGQDRADGGEGASGAEGAYPYARSQAARLRQAMRGLRAFTFQAEDSVNQQIGNTSVLPVPGTHTRFHSLWMAGAQDVLSGVRKFRAAVESFEHSAASVPAAQETLEFDNTLFEEAESVVTEGLRQIEEAAAVQREMVGAGATAEKAGQPA